MPSTTPDSGGGPAVAIVTASGDLSREAIYVRQALAVSAPDGQVYEVEGVRAAGLSTYDEARWTRHAAVILLSTRGLDQKGRERLAGYLRAGGGIFIAAGEDVDGEVVAETLGGEAPIGVVDRRRASGRDPREEQRSIGRCPGETGPPGEVKLKLGGRGPHGFYIAML